MIKWIPIHVIFNMHTSNRETEFLMYHRTEFHMASEVHIPFSKKIVLADISEILFKVENQQYK